MIPVKSYLRSLLRVSRDLSLVFVIANVILLNPLAIYTLFASFIIAFSGPIADALNKKESDDPTKNV